MTLQVRYFHRSSPSKIPSALPPKKKRVPFLLHFPRQNNGDRRRRKNARQYRLQLAIDNDDIDDVHNLIVEEPELLDRVSKGPFPNTPLHIAAAVGKTNVAMEMAILKPSFALMLNSKGYSPVHLALQHKQYHTVRALVILDPQLIRVRGRGRITPLHFVARGKGDNEQENKELLELLAEFLSTCKSSIEDLTSQCETAVHVAVKNHNLKAFEVLFGWLKRVHLTKILNWKDQDGNTVLHITASEEQKPEIIKLLIGYTNINVKNFHDKTALEIFQENRSGDQDVMKRLRRQKCRAKWSTPLSLSQFFRKELSVVEKYACCFGIQDDARDIILQVSTLIATATYQAALTPPGGYWQEDSSNPLANFTIGPADSNGTAIGKPHKAGNMILNGSDLYLFTAFNSTVFLTSIGTIWATAVTLMPDTFMVYCSISSLVAAFLLTLTIEFPKRNRVGGLGLFYDCLAFVMLFLPIYFWRKHARVRKQIDARGRLVGNF